MRKDARLRYYEYSERSNIIYLVLTRPDTSHLPCIDQTWHLSTDQEKEETCRLHGKQESEGPVRGHVRLIIMIYAEIWKFKLSNDIIVKSIINDKCGNNILYKNEKRLNDIIIVKSIINAMIISYTKMKQGQMTIKPSILFSNVTDIWSQLYRYINQIHRTFGTF